MSIDRKNVIWNIIGATTNALISLVFTIIVTRVNGINDAGIFTYSFATACLLYVIAVYLGRAFQVTDLKVENTDTDYIYNRIFTCIIMLIVSIGFVVLKKYEVYKSVIFVILCGYKCIEAFSEAIYAIIQKNNELYKVGISMFIKAGLGMFIFFIIDYITKNLIVSSISVILVNIIFLIIYDAKNVKKAKIVKTKYSWKSNKRLLKTGFFAFALNFLGIYLINAPRYAIDDMQANDLQTIFGIIIMPATFMGLLGQYVIQPLLVRISDYIKNKKYDDLRNIIIKTMGIIIVLGTAVFVIAYFLEVPVLQIVYGIELKQYFTSMLIIIAGSILYSIGIVISTILISMRKTFIQTIIYGVTAVISTILSYNLVKKLEIEGASITYFITMLIVAILFITYLIYNMKKYKRNWEILNENIDNNSNI